MEASTATNGKDQTPPETGIKHMTLTARISIWALAMLSAAEDVGAQSLIPEDVDLDAIVLRGEDDCVVDAEVKPDGELAP
jgi:hypothetical protein